jgi:polyhydroxybutyrate depolymerase
MPHRFQRAREQDEHQRRGVLSGMIDYFSTNYKISSDKVFAVGTSGGGHMSYKLAMTMPKKIRAITAIMQTFLIPITSIVWI